MEEDYSACAEILGRESAYLLLARSQFLTVLLRCFAATYMFVAVFFIAQMNVTEHDAQYMCGSGHNMWAVDFHQKQVFHTLDNTWSIVAIYKKCAA